MAGVTYWQEARDNARRQDSAEVRKRLENRAESLLHALLGGLLHFKEWRKLQTLFLTFFPLEPG